MFLFRRSDQTKSIPIISLSLSPASLPPPPKKNKKTRWLLGIWGYIWAINGWDFSNQTDFHKIFNGKATNPIDPPWMILRASSANTTWSYCAPNKTNLLNTAGVFFFRLFLLQKDRTSRSSTQSRWTRSWIKSAFSLSPLTESTHQ